ncbi:PREDICTED: uncharacterized protein LOC109463176 [Branchiostoma belcheri]|uniref:Uncharacterized protein LOC109463176 n=1 Tax=Branchiostoma belcheri TaxID=7741 RepID=A0A6P4XYA6_BRABE|nr:PREDICTED: uncharacterized protein LOC109463176 [Branchiostoma belcheri]KAI8478594.1 hypothetical protein Bbelb_436770 [Branchiostoma belcheri]
MLGLVCVFGLLSLAAGADYPAGVRYSVYHVVDIINANSRLPNLYVLEEVIRSAESPQDEVTYQKFDIRLGLSDCRNDPLMPAEEADEKCVVSDHGRNLMCSSEIVQHNAVIMEVVEGSGNVVEDDNNVRREVNFIRCRADLSTVPITG